MSCLTRPLWTTAWLRRRCLGARCAGACARGVHARRENVGAVHVVAQQLVAAQSCHPGQHTSPHILGRSPTPSPLPSSDDIEPHPDAAPVHPELDRDEDPLLPPAIPPAAPTPVQPCTLIQTFNVHMEVQLGFQIAGVQIWHQENVVRLAWSIYQQLTNNEL